MIHTKTRIISIRNKIWGVFLEVTLLGRLEQACFLRLSVHQSIY